MTALKALVLLPAWFLLSGFTLVDNGPSASPSPADTPSSTPSASPSPSPSPSGPPPFINLDVTAGGPSTAITVSGGNFPHTQPISIYWDTGGKVIGSTTTDGRGNIPGVKVKPFAGDPPGLHHICASFGSPNPCAQFVLQGPPSPTPTPQPSPSESPSPSPSPSPTESPTPTPIALPVSSNNNGLDALIRPPFIFLPFLAALALLGAIAYWALGRGRRSEASLPAAAIVHRSVRPGYAGAEFDIRPMPLGPTPPTAPPPEQPEPPVDGGEEPPPITES